MGHNPNTGEEVPISARRVVVFKPVQILKHRVNHSEGLAFIFSRSYARWRSSLAGEGSPYIFGLHSLANLWASAI